MAIDCERLSPKAQEIFAKLRPYLPDQPFGRKGWREEGIVCDEGDFDLRKAEDRKRFEEERKGYIAHHMLLLASEHEKAHGSLDTFQLGDGLGALVRQHLEVLLILTELDFQIETLDLVEQ